MKGIRLLVVLFAAAFSVTNGCVEQQDHERVSQLAKARIVRVSAYKSTEYGEETWTVTSPETIARICEHLSQYEEGWKAWWGTSPASRWQFTVHYDNGDSLRIRVNDGYIATHERSKKMPVTETDKLWDLVYAEDDPSVERKSDDFLPRDIMDMLTALNAVTNIPMDEYLEILGSARGRDLDRARSELKRRMKKHGLTSN